MIGKLWAKFIWPVLASFPHSVRATERHTGPWALARCGWFWVAPKNNRGHVLPIGDSREHKLSTRCWCKPKVDSEIVSHNAKDGRE